jgi:hypothetical protein
MTDHIGGIAARGEQSGRTCEHSTAKKAVASSYGLKPDQSAIRRTQVTLKLSSGSGGFWFLMYSVHTSSVTFPLLATR